jgi:hypothetical protein
MVAEVLFHSLGMLLASTLISIGQLSTQLFHAEVGHGYL